MWESQNCVIFYMITIEFDKITMQYCLEYICTTSNFSSFIDIATAPLRLFIINKSYIPFSVGLQVLSACAVQNKTFHLHVPGGSSLTQSSVTDLCNTEYHHVNNLASRKLGNMCFCKKQLSKCIYVFVSAPYL